MTTERIERLAAMGAAALAILKTELVEECDKKRSRCRKLQNSCFHTSSESARESRVANLRRELFTLDILARQERLVDGALLLATQWGTQ